MDSQCAPADRRRRGAELEEALLDAAWDELAERGYAGLTYEGVAARAGTSRTVLYRRWPEKKELALAAVRHRGAQDLPQVPDTGNLRDDLVGLLEDVNRRRGEVGLVLATVAKDFHADTGLTPRDVREHWLGDRPSGMLAVIDRAVARGEVDPARVTPRTVSLASDLWRTEVIMTMGSAGREALTQIVDEVVVPVLTGRPPRRV